MDFFFIKKNKTATKDTAKDLTTFSRRKLSNFTVEKKNLGLIPNIIANHFIFAPHFCMGQNPTLVHC